MQDLNHPVENLATESQENPSLDQLIKEFEHWRVNKTKQSSPIPDELWKKIFILADTYSGAKMRVHRKHTIKQTTCPFLHAMFQCF